MISWREVVRNERVMRIDERKFSFLVVHIILVA